MKLKNIVKLLEITQTDYHFITIKKKLKKGYCSQAPLFLSFIFIFLVKSSLQTILDFLNRLPRHVK